MTHRISFTLALILLLCNWGHAQTASTNPSIQDLLERLERNERETQTLRDRLDEANKQIQALEHKLDSSQSIPTEQAIKQTPADRVRANRLEFERWMKDYTASRRSDSLPDPGIVKQGKLAFESACTQCHDSSRALSKSGDQVYWSKVVRRMSRKRDANVPDSVQPAIVAYLTGQSGSEDQGARTAEAQSRPTEPIDIWATISTIWRGSSTDNVLQNPGFFPEVWVGVEWHPDMPIQARAVACITCHTQGSQGSRIELVEAAATFNVSDWLADLNGHADGDQDVDVSVEAGRFIVPFGAFSSQSHPGAFRTVTKPLMFNMGQGVNRNLTGDPVLPLPYSDEGGLVSLSVPIHGDWVATADGYLVNGLQGFSNGVSFFQSRDYVDNNSQPAYGGRLTLAGPQLTLGTSLMSGRYNSDQFADGLGYRVLGADAAFRVTDEFRLQAEYAIRTTDQQFGAASGDEEVRGWNIEAELRLWNQPKLWAVVRYDTLDRTGDFSPPTGQLVNSQIDRITWGFNVGMPGGSLLLINHEHWMFANDADSVNVIGVRWVGTF